MQSELPKPGQPRDTPESIVEFFIDNWFFVLAAAIVILIMLTYSKVLRDRKK